jgi:glycosyltransferase involved in cell wall biosynthesis
MKKVLVITYYWPPAGGPGVQRVLKFVKFLPRYGWNPVVLTVRQGEYMAIDESLADEVSEDLSIYRTETSEPFSLYKKLLGKKNDSTIPNLILTEKSSTSMIQALAKWVRTNLFIPDARLGWIPHIVRHGMKIIAEEKPDLIFSSSPPHSLQLGAMKLARKSKIKWIADFRDLWYDLDIFYEHNRRNSISAAIDGYLERKVLSRADGITTASPYYIELFSPKVSGKVPFRSIVSGFDGSLFPKKSLKPDSREFTIVYAGTLSESRIPHVLLDVLSNFKSKSPVSIKLKLIGSICEQMKKQVKRKQLEGITEYIAYKPHTVLIRDLRRAAMLLMVIDDVPHNVGLVAGKIFDYLGARRPILVIGPPESEVAKIIRETNSGITLDYWDNEGVKQFLSEMIDSWQEDNTPFSFHVESYEKQSLTKELADFFNLITG